MPDLAHITADEPLVSRCWFDNVRIFLGRARLTPEGIVVTGWRHRGWHRRRIPLDELEGVGWHQGVGERRGVTLFFRNGEEETLLLEGAGLWRLALERMLAGKGQSAPTAVSQKRYAVRRLYVALPMAGDAPPVPNLGSPGDGLRGRAPLPETPRTSDDDRRPTR